jgi:hypothetical protein
MHFRPTVQNILSLLGVRPVNGCCYKILLRPVAELPSQSISRDKSSFVDLAMRLPVI